jgi:uncharacterized protein
MKFMWIVFLILCCPSVFAASFDDAWTALLKRDFVKSEKLFRELDEAKDPYGAFGLGVMHQFGYGEVEKNYVKALNYYQLSASKGVIGAMHNIGYFYQHGLGVKTDMSEAVRWYQKSADNGLATAMHDLAVIFHDGVDGIQKDYAKAAGLYEKAAKAGVRQSMHNLGYMYAYAQGVKQDRVAAYAYLTTAKKLGENVDSELINWLEQRLSVDDMSKAKVFSNELMAFSNEKPHAPIAPWR